MKTPVVVFMLSTILYAIIFYILVIRPFFHPPNILENLLIYIASLIVSILLFTYGMIETFIDSSAPSK